MKQNQKGFSLVEALVGVALISSLAVVVTKTTTASRAISSFEGGTCRSVLTSIFTSLESQGTYSNVINYIPRDGARVPNPANFNSAWTPGGLGLFQAGDPESVVLDQGEIPVLRNHKLIHGSVSVVNALYNEGSYSGQFAPYNVFRVDNAGPANANNLTVATSLDKDAAARNGGLIAQMKIEPYNIDSGAILPVAGAINIVPRGDAANQIGAEVTPAAGLTITTGFLVTLRLTADGQPCTMSKRFQYDRDTNLPPVPTFAITRNTTTGLNAPARLNNCQAPAANNSVTLTLNYTAPANMEPGSQFVCLDRSGIVDWRNAANNPMPHINNVSGWISQAPGGFVGATSVASNAPVFNNYSGEGRQNTAPANLNWVACDQLTICGVNPVTAGPFDGAGRLNLTLTYNNLPQDCKVAADVRAIDTARNASAVTALDVAHNLVVNPAGQRSCTERSVQVDNFTINRSNSVDYYWNRYGDHAGATIKRGLIRDTNAMASNLSYHNGYTTCGAAVSCQAAGNTRSTPFGDLWFDWFVSGGATDHSGASCGGVQTCGRNFTGTGVPGIAVANESNTPVNDGFCLGSLPAGSPVVAVAGGKPADPIACPTYAWQNNGVFGACSVSGACGQTGVRAQGRVCVATYSNGTTSNVSNAQAATYCGVDAGTPATTACSTAACAPPAPPAPSYVPPATPPVNNPPTTPTTRPWCQWVHTGGRTNELGWWCLNGTSCGLHQRNTLTQAGPEFYVHGPASIPHYHLGAQVSSARCVMTQQEVNSPPTTVVGPGVPSSQGSFRPSVPSIDTGCNSGGNGHQQCF